MAERERLRLFCALCLPAPTIGSVVEWQSRELRGGRVVPGGNLHITLAFLGSRPARDVAAAAEALSESVAGVRGIRLRPRAYRETRSVGMLVLDDEGGRASILAERLHERLERLGLYLREKRPWLPHLTVIRYPLPPGLQPPLPDLGEVAPSDAAVFISRLRSDGARYEAVETVPLGG